MNELAQPFADLSAHVVELEAELDRLRDVAEHKAVLAQSALDAAQKLEAELERLREDNEKLRFYLRGASVVEGQAEEFARLHRIEEAARKALEELKDPAWDLYTLSFVSQVLRAALEKP